MRPLQKKKKFEEAKTMLSRSSRLQCRNPQRYRACSKLDHINTKNQGKTRMCGTPTVSMNWTAPRSDFCPSEQTISSSAVWRAECVLISFRLFEQHEEHVYVMKIHIIDVFPQIGGRNTSCLAMFTRLCGTMACCFMFHTKSQKQKAHVFDYLSKFVITSNNPYKPKIC